MSLTTYAVVFRMYGDPEIGNAIKDGMLQSTQRLNRDELKVVQDECLRMRVSEDCRRVAICGGRGRDYWEDKMSELPDKYEVKQHSRLMTLLLGLYGLVVYLITEEYKRQSSAWRG